MKISEIIKGFQEIQENHGDVDVYIRSPFNKRMLDEFYIGEDAVTYEALNGIIISPRIEIN